MRNDWGHLLGVAVLAVFVSEGDDHLAFQTSKKREHPTYPGKDVYLIYETQGDCCSETWFADITGLDNLLGDWRNEITGVRVLDVPAVEDGRTRQECDSFYGIRLTTKKGDCDIIYRNSSNGYYGGSSFLSSSTFGEYTWKETTENDWQA